MNNMGYELSVIEEKKISYNEKEQFFRNNFKFFGGISFIYGLIYLFCMYQNYFGAAFLIYTIATVVVLQKFLNKMEIKINKETKAYFAGIILCGISTCITANKGIQFMNWCCMINLLILAMISQFYQERKWNVIHYIKNMLILFFTTIGYSFLSVGETKNNMINSELKNDKNLKLVMAGIGAAMAVLVFIFPLLVSSDMIFDQVFYDVFSIFDFEEIVPTTSKIIKMFLTFFAGFTLIYAFFYASCHSQFEINPERKMKYYSPVTGITFTGIMAAVYGFYSFIQIRYLFLGDGLPEGITYSEYAHQGFWQLLVVAFINICMVMACSYLFEENKWLNTILTMISACTFVMIASAFRRMQLYVEAYHLTWLRVVVLWALTVLAFIMAGVIWNIYKKNFKFMQYVIAVIVCGYLALSFSRPDYLIVKYNISQMEEISSSDLYYMMYGLSMDAAPAIAEIDQDSTKIEYFTFTGDDFYDYFRQILEENEDMTIRSATYSKIKANEIANKYFEEFMD